MDTKTNTNNPDSTVPETSPPTIAIPIHDPSAPPTTTDIPSTDITDPVPISDIRSTANADGRTPRTPHVRPVALWRRDHMIYMQQQEQRRLQHEMPPMPPMPPAQIDDEVPNLFLPRRDSTDQEDSGPCLGCSCKCTVAFWGFLFSLLTIPVSLVVVSSIHVLPCIPERVTESDFVIGMNYGAMVGFVLMIVTILVLRGIESFS